MEHPLHQRRILIPREPARAAALSELLQGLGAHTTVVPVQHQVAHASADVAREPRTQLAWAGLAAGEYPVAAFTSVNTVQFSLAHPAYQGIHPETVLAAVGPATERALRETYPHHRILASPDITSGITSGKTSGITNGAELATRIAETFERAPVFFACAVGARPELKNILTAAGHRVDSLEIYRSETLPTAPPALLAAFEPPPDAILFTSPSSVTALAELVSVKKWGRAVRCAIGRTTAHALHTLAGEKMADGAPTPIVVAAAPHPEAIVAALSDFFARSTEGEL